MTSLLDKIKGKRAAIAENRASMTRAYKFKPGKTAISLLPLHDDPYENKFFREFGMHYIKNKLGENVVVVGDRSLCFPGETCPVREGLVGLMRHANNIGDDEMANAAKESLGKGGYLIGGMVHQDPDKKAEADPQLFQFSTDLFDKLLSSLEEYLQDGSDDLLRFNQRLMFIVERTGTTKTDTRYSIYPAAKRIDVDPAVMGKAVNIENYVKGQFDASVAKALSYISTAQGKPLAASAFAAALTAAPGSGTKALPATTVADDEDLLAAAPAVSEKRAAASPALAETRVVDAEFTEVAKTPTPTPSSSAAALMAEIDDLAA